MDRTDGWTRRYSELTAFPKAVTKPLCSGAPSRSSIEGLKSAVIFVLTYGLDAA